MEQLTVESLARAIHEDEAIALERVGVERQYNSGPVPSYDKAPERLLAIRREQARLLLNRIMR